MLTHDGYKVHYYEPTFAIEDSIKGEESVRQGKHPHSDLLINGTPCSALRPKNQRGWASVPGMAERHVYSFSGASSPNGFFAPVMMKRAPREFRLHEVV